MRSLSITPFLEKQLQATGDLGYEWCPDKAVPVLEKAATDRPEIAAKLSGLISRLEPMLNPLSAAQKPQAKLEKPKCKHIL